jgi:hypothetical protein
LPDHQEVKWAQLVWRIHEPQGGTPFHHLPHAIGQCEDEFRSKDLALHCARRTRYHLRRYDYTKIDDW